MPELLLLALTGAFAVLLILVIIFILFKLYHRKRSGSGTRRSGWNIALGGNRFSVEYTSGGQGLVPISHGYGAGPVKDTRDVATFLDMGTADREWTRCNVEVSFTWGIEDPEKVRSEVQREGGKGLVDRLREHIELAVERALSNRTRFQIETGIGNVEGDIKEQARVGARLLGLYIDDVRIRIVKWSS